MNASASFNQFIFPNAFLGYPLSLCAGTARSYALFFLVFNLFKFLLSCEVFVTRAFIF